MKILIGCETSGIVRRAFTMRGFDAWSCDIKPSTDRSNKHLQCNILDILNDGWDMLMVAHPPCTRLCNSGVRWLTDPPTQLTSNDYSPEIRAQYQTWNRSDRLKFMWDQLDKGAELFSRLWNANIPRIAIENPVMHRHAKARIRNFRPHTQSVQPWQFATDPDGPDNVKKRTLLWLRELPRLIPTGTLDGSNARADIHNAPPGPDRSKIRSTFFPGLAEAMATQWGDVLQ